MGTTLRRGWGILLLLLAAAAPCAAHAANFDYDQLGRLVRSIDSQGRVTEYIYDPAGNLLQVIQGGAATAPQATSISPSTVRRNRAPQVQITGSGLAGSSLSSDDPNIAFTGVFVTPTSVTFRILVRRGASLGPHALTLRNAAGTATANIEVLAENEYVVGPPPVAIPPDGSTRQYRFEAPFPEELGLDMTVSTSHSTIARPGTLSVSLPLGAAQATGTLIGVAAGETTLRFSSPTLVDPIEVPVLVSTDFANGSVARTGSVGLVKGDPSVPGTNAPSATASPMLGIVKGDPSAPGVNSPTVTHASGIGITKGDPTTTGANTPTGTYSPDLGLSKSN